MTTIIMDLQPQMPKKASIFTRVSISTLAEDEKNCPICLEPFQESDCPIQLPCKHVLGRDCLMTWLSTDNTCPQCRRTVFDESDEAEFDDAEAEMNDMVERALESPAEEWPNDRAKLISLLEEKDEQEEEEVNRIRMFTVEHTTAAEAPNGLLRFVLALAGANPGILTDGACAEFLKELEEQGPDIFEPWCSTEEFGATVVLIKQELLGLN